MLQKSEKGVIGSLVFETHSFSPILEDRTQARLGKWGGRCLSRAPLTDKTQSTPDKALLITRGNRDPALYSKCKMNSQRSDHDNAQLIDFLQAKKLPDDPEVAMRIKAQLRKGYYVIEGILFL